MAIRFLNSQSIDGELTVTGNVGIGTTTPSEKLEVVGNIRTANNSNIYADGTGYLRLGNTANGVIEIKGDGGESIIEGSVNHLVLQTARDADDIILKGGASTTEYMRIEGDTGNVGINNTSPDYELDVDGDIQYSGTLFNGPRQEYVGSNFISANQAYTGNLVGSYFVGGDYQKIVTIIPSGASQNYQIVGNIYVQSGSSTQVIEVNASLRSNTLPDLSWEIYYEESNTGTRFVKPFLWTKETTTAGFIFGIEVLSGITIYGSVTADLMINSRSSADKANVSINTVTSSDQLTIDTGYTQQEFTQRSTWDENYLGIGTTTPDSPLHIWFDDNNAAEKVFLNIESGYSTDNPIFQVGTKLGDGFMRLKDKFDISKVQILSAGNSYFNGGNVGIGTTSPSEKLEVAGNIMIDNNTALLSKRVAGNTVNLIGIDNTGQGVIEIGEASTIADGMHIYTPTDAGQGVTFHNGTDPLMFIENDGNVGIGTTSPDKLLVVSGNGAEIVINDTDTTDNPRLRFRESGATSGSIYTDAGELIFDSSTSEKMRIDTTGNVGIGTTNPGYLLDVQSSADSVIRVKTIGTGPSSDSEIRMEVAGTTQSNYIRFGDSGNDYAGGIRYQHVNNSMQFRVNAAERMRIDSNGDVGIGTTNPIAKLYVDGGSLGGTAGDDIALLSLKTLNGNTDTLQFTSERLSTGTDWTSAAQRIQRKIDTTLMGYIQFGSHSDDLITFGENNTERMRIDGDGNVGIGTTNPSEKLEVVGNADISGDLFTGNNITARSATTQSSILSLGQDRTGNGYSYIDLIGDATYSDYGLRIIRNNSGANTSSVIQHRGTGNFNFNTTEAAPIRFQTTNAERMRITADGNVGIGTTSPTQKLHVTGNARVTGAYYDSNNSPGTSGQVLSSTATGTSWVTGGGGGGGATSLNGLSDVLIDGTSSYFVNVPTTLSGNPADNLVIGNGAGNSITTATKNVIIGKGAGNNITTSVSNVVIGYNAGQGLRTGGTGRNIIIGQEAGTSVNQGYGNIMIGYRAGQSANQQNSIYIGYEAAKASSSINGIAIGYRAMYKASGGQRSTVVGYQVLYNTTGSFVEHTAFGYQTLYSQTSGRLNTAFGYSALRSGTTFNDNVAFGYKAGFYVTGTGNTLLGCNSGNTGTNNLTTGGNNTLIGNDSQASSATVSNEFTLGNSSISTLRCAVTSITSLSDERDKAEIKDLTYGLDFIDSLQPREFVWNNRPEIKLEQVIDENGEEVFDENEDPVYEEVEFYSNNRGKKDFGFVAQEVQDLDDDTLRLVYDSNPNQLEISYGKLVPILVKAIQELKAEIETLKSQ